MDGQAEPTLVDTQAGKVRGQYERGVQAFRGIPYAVAPRFRPPVRPDPWTETLDATRFGPVAPQLPSPLVSLLGGSTDDLSEHCLSVNVWTPGLDGRRPVMVWIHGGAFVMGSGSTPWYDGRNFAASGDVVLVTINYRLGAFGFTCLDEIGGTEYAGSGNAGIRDQIAALEWVRDNIAAFGGDADDVTIFGESAGAMSVGTLLGTPDAQGLFHKAILQSGAAQFVAKRDDAGRTAAGLLTAAGVDDVAGLVELSMTDLLDAQRRMLEADGGLGLPFRPVVDGVVLAEPPLDAMRSGACGNVPVLVGTNRDEMTLFLILDPTLGELDGSGLVSRAAQMFGEGAAQAVAAYEANRPGAASRDVLVAIASDAVFRVPALRLVEAQIAKGHSAHSYYFTWATPAFDGALGSTHALEIPFVFDNLDQPGAAVFTGDSTDRPALAETMHSAWIRFAHTADPGWPTYDLDRRATRMFDGVDNPVIDDPGGTERELWSDIDPEESAAKATG
ncbi:MAG TPA: carboxylesterase/lipase family protein [Acidimicrobiia bacterium]|nr:carboxylesterase/lipase family protein [Acidimicrobiia bacterium]